MTNKVPAKPIKAQIILSRVIHSFKIYTESTTTIIGAIRRRLSALGKGIFVIDT